MLQKKQIFNYGSFQRIFVLVMIVSFSYVHGYAQERNISGSITSAKGEPLIGVLVSAKGQSQTISDINGKYSIAVPLNGTLIFKSVGFIDKTVQTTNLSLINVILEESDQELDEIVVVGYGTVKKKNLTGAVSVIKSEAIKNRVSGDVAGALKGLASGVKVTSSGLAGDQASIQIRGIGNLTNFEPLYVIDGIPSSGTLHLNMNDVESIQVLKDASSAAIYGSRAANGVIIVTTKQGQAGATKIDFSNQATLNWLPRYDLMDAEEYKLYNDFAYNNAITQGIEGITTTQRHFDANTDWQDRMLQTGLLQNYNASISGGSENGKYYLSLNGMDDTGTLKNTGYNRYGFRVNTNGKKNIFSFGQNLNYNTSQRVIPHGNVFANILNIAPTIPVYNNANSGGFGYGDPDRANTYALNPIAMQDLLNQKNKENSLKGNIFGQVDILKSLFAKLNFGYSDYNGTTNTLRKEGNWTMGQGTDHAYITKDNFQGKTIILENTYNFKKTINKHDIDALGGISYQYDWGEKHYTTRLDPILLNGNYLTSIDAATGLTTGGSFITEAALLSYLGRLNYTYDNKYLLSATLRRDGSSRFQKSNRWGNFPSLSLGWRISEEKFFKIPFISDLKVRANYGTLGGSNIGYWDYQAFINTAPRAIFGANDDIAIGMTQSQIVNTDLIWEKTKQANIGFDASMLNGKLSLTAEYFNSTTEDVLVYLPVLLTTGNAGGNPAVNAASLRNAGVELEINWRDKIKSDFSYDIGLNFTKLNNKILNLGYGQDVFYSGLSISEIGSSLGAWYLYKSMGIFQSYNDVINHKTAEGNIIQPDANPGDIIYDDFSKDGVINASDRQLAGSPWPKFEAGLTISAKYKGFDVLINGFGRFGQKVWNGSAATVGDFNNNQNNFKNLKPWTEENKSLTQPRIVYGYSANSTGAQDRWLEDGSFFRIGELSLGYTIPTRVTKKVGLDYVRTGLAVNNLITFTKYSGLDPDFKDVGIFSIGVDGATYPNAKSVLFSLSFGF